MNVEEFYNKYSNDYNSVLKRLLTKENMFKYLNLFLKDNSYNDLTKSIINQDVEGSFISSHNLKGICANLGIDALYKPASEICEIFRSGLMNMDALVLKGKIDNLYNEIIRDISNLTI